MIDTFVREDSGNPWRPLWGLLGGCLVTVCALLFMGFATLLLGSVAAYPYQASTMVYAATHLVGLRQLALFGLFYSSGALFVLAIAMLARLIGMHVRIAWVAPAVLLLYIGGMVWGSVEYERYAESANGTEVVLSDRKVDGAYLSSKDGYVWLIRPDGTIWGHKNGGLTVVLGNDTGQGGGT